VSAAYTKGFAARLAHGGVAAVISSRQLYACAAAGPDSRSSQTARVAEHR
jgi:hypothetical protein